MEKKFNPKAGIKMIPYEREIVAFIDKLLEVANRNGSKGALQTSLDWNTLDFLYKGWKVLYPEDASTFENHMKQTHTLNYRRDGIAKEKNAMIQHILEIPSPLYQMIKVIFPDQKWDKRFVRDFAKHFPGMRGYEK
jgi:hypothetical protein